MRLRFTWSTQILFPCLLLIAVPGHALAAKNLSSFAVVQYDTNVQPCEPAVWVLTSGNTAVTQTCNNEPSFFLGDFDAAGMVLEWDARVSSTDDDDFGFVWGWQQFGDFYLFGWGNATNSMQVVRADCGSSDPFATPSCFTELVAASSPPNWANETDYHFLVDLTPGDTTIEVTEGANLVESFTITDSTYGSGSFGFYTHSLGSVTFSNLVPEPTTAVLLGTGLISLGWVRHRSTRSRFASDGEVP